MTININSEKFCREAYINVRYHNNTIGLTPDEIGAISAKWESKLKTWDDIGAQSKDETFYDTSDESWDNGRKYAQGQAGYEHTDSDRRWQTGRAVGDAVFAGVNTLGQAFGKTVFQDWGCKVLGQKVLNKGLEKTGEMGLVEEVGNCTSFIVGCTMGLATGIAYVSKNPNKEQKEALDKLQGTMGESNTALAGAQEQMRGATTELQALQEEAAEVNDAANTQMEEDKASYDMYKVRYDELKAKIDAGESLTEEEKAEFKKLQEYMGVVAENIQGAQDDATSQVGEIYENMESFEGEYADAADTIGEAQGVTDFAASFDESTRTMCWVEAVAQGVNAASSTWAGTKAGIFAASGSWALGATAWAWAFAAMGAAGAYMSGKGAYEQGKMALEISDEIKFREQTQEFTETTIGVYNDEYDAFDGFKTGVEELELEVPEDTEAPQDVDIPAGNTNSSEANSVDPKKKQGIPQ